MTLNVNNFVVVAVFKADNYAGETTYTLEKVLIDPTIEEYTEVASNYEYAIRLCKLSDVFEGWDTETTRAFAKRLKNHYPHSPSVCNTIDKVANEMLGRGKDETDNFNRW